METTQDQKQHHHSNNKRWSFYSLRSFKQEKGETTKPNRESMYITFEVLTQMGRLKSDQIILTDSVKLRRLRKFVITNWKKDVTEKSKVSKTSRNSFEHRSSKERTTVKKRIPPDCFSSHPDPRYIETPNPWKLKNIYIKEKLTTE